MLSSPSGSSDSDDSSIKRDGERREGAEDERARQEHQEQPIPSSSGASAPRPALTLSDAEAAAAGAALKRARATARARRKGSLLASSSAPRAANVIRSSSNNSSHPPPPPPPPSRILDPALATSDADAAARLRAWLSSTLSRPSAARSAYARHRAAVVRKALALLETKRSEAQDAELQALLGGLSL